MKTNKTKNKSQRQIHNAIMGDTLVQTVHHRQYIDNISAYDSDLQRISKSEHHKLDLGQNSLPGAQQYTTVKAAAAIKVQDKTIKVQDKVVLQKYICQMIMAKTTEKYTEGQNI